MNKNQVTKSTWKDEELVHVTIFWRDANTDPVEVVVDGKAARKFWEDFNTYMHDLIAELLGTSVSKPQTKVRFANDQVFLPRISVLQIEDFKSHVWTLTGY